MEYLVFQRPKHIHNTHSGYVCVPNDKGLAMNFEVLTMYLCGGSLISFEAVLSNEIMKNGKGKHWMFYQSGIFPFVTDGEGIYLILCDTFHSV